VADLCDVSSDPWPNAYEGNPVTPPADITRGVQALHQLLLAQTFDLRHLDVAGFRRWLDAHLAR
jgi:hypothetical protein